MRRISNRASSRAPAGQDLSAIDAEHTGAKHLGDEGRLVGGQRQTRGPDRTQFEAICGNAHRRTPSAGSAACRGRSRNSPGRMQPAPRKTELHCREDKTKDQPRPVRDRSPPG